MKIYKAKHKGGATKILILCILLLLFAITGSGIFAIAFGCAVYYMMMG